MEPDQLDALSDAASRGEVFAYFGYGSLVNRDTHRTETFGAMKASVRGWRRHWQGRPRHGDRPISLLSVKAETDPDHALPGLLVFDRIGNLPALDDREFNYHRRTLDPAAVITELPSDFGVPLYIYEAKQPHSADAEHAILQSYLDAVLQGYLCEYGIAAVKRFIADTHAFDRPVIRDRHAPRYQRKVALADEERSLFDDALRSHGVAFREIPDTINFR